MARTFFRGSFALIQSWLENKSHGRGGSRKLTKEVSPLGSLLDLVEVSNDEIDRSLLQNFCIVGEASSEEIDRVFEFQAAAEVLLAALEQWRDHVLVRSRQEVNVDLVERHIIGVDKLQKWRNRFRWKIDDFDFAGLALQGGVVAKHGPEHFRPGTEEHTVDLELLTTADLFSNFKSDKQQQKNTWTIKYGLELEND